MVNVGLILSSDTFKIFSLMFIERISGINPVSTSQCVSLSVIVKFKILHLVETLNPMKHESENRAHIIMMKNTKNTYVFALR